MSPRAPKTHAPTFEQAIARLEEIVVRMDHPETGLEETIALTAEGHELYRNCCRLLADAELKIQQLSQPEQTPQAQTTAASDTTSHQAAATAQRQTAPSPDDDNGFCLL